MSLDVENLSLDEMEAWLDFSYTEFSSSMSQVEGMWSLFVDYKND